MTPPKAGLLAEWLRHVGLEGCVCTYRWQTLGRLYGICMGWGWVRQRDDANCVHHAPVPPTNITKAAAATRTLIELERLRLADGDPADLWENITPVSPASFMNPSG